MSNNEIFKYDKGQYIILKLTILSTMIFAFANFGTTVRESAKSTSKVYYCNLIQAKVFETYYIIVEKVARRQAKQL